MRKVYVLTVLATAVLGIGIGVMLHSRFDARASAQPTPSAGQATWPAGARPAPAFALRDQDNHIVSLRSLRGRSVVLGFMDSLCKEACPLEGHMLAAAISRVPSARRPRIVIVSVNPWGDTRATAKAAIAKWHLEGNVSWLLGSHAELARVWRAYRITVVPVKGDILHSTALYLIDHAGNERAGYLVPFAPAAMARDLTNL